MKKTIAILLTLVLMLSLAACGGSSAPAATEAPEAPADSPVFKIGICQLVQHDALDAATKGFRDAIISELGKDAVDFDEQNASGDTATCSSICTQFVSNEVDLIMANATPAVLAAQSATGDIPILGTSVTDYASALGIDDWTGATGLNISGTSDLAPLDGQAQMLKELFPDAKKVGILYCSGEPNSKYQAEVITGYLTEMGFEVVEFTFADSNDVSPVTANACDEVDVIYIPTDNTAASCAEQINNVALPAGVPIIAGEEGLCKGCGVATLSISYYDLGWATGLMAVDILVDGADVSTMDIQFAPQFTKKVNTANAEALGITVPEDYEAIAE